MALCAHVLQHFEYPVVSDPPRREADVGRSCSSGDVGQSVVGQSVEPRAAVDMLFSYHQMTTDAGDDGLFSERCSPAVVAPTQQATSTPPPPSLPRSAVHFTQHYYV